MEDCSNCSALAMELLQSCTEASILNAIVNKKQNTKILMKRVSINETCQVF